MSRVNIASMVVVCLLGHSHALHGQSITGGIKGGITAARMPGVTDAIGATVDEQSRWGASAGMFVAFRLKEFVSIQPEALFVMKGETLKAGPGYTVSFHANYLEAPLFFRFGRSDRRMYVLAGPSIAFRLSADGRETVNGMSETRDFTDETTGVDVGLSFGGGVNFGRILVEARWTEGLRDLDNGSEFGTDVRHRAFAMLAGFRF